VLKIVVGAEQPARGRGRLLQRVSWACSPRNADDMGVPAPDSGIAECSTVAERPLPDRTDGRVRGRDVRPPPRSPHGRRPDRVRSRTCGRRGAGWSVRAPDGSIYGLIAVDSNRLKHDVDALDGWSLIEPGSFPADAFLRQAVRAHDRRP
jgi:hypothetical protein